MSSNEGRIERRLRHSGVLLILGLLVEAASLLWHHPLSFLGFMFVDGFLMGAGVLFICTRLFDGRMSLRHSVAVGPASCMSRSNQRDVPGFTA